MRAYSHDLRERIVAAAQQGAHSLRQVARLAAVSLSCVVRLLQRYRQTGSVPPEPHAGGPTPKLDAQAHERLLDLVRQHPEATPAELRAQLGVPCCLMTIARALQRHRITRKKKALRAEEQGSPRVQAQRKRFQKKLAAVDPAHLVFVDESGATTAMTRLYGRAPCGQRVPATAPGQWQNVTLVAGVRATGVVAPMAWVGPTDQALFEASVEQVLVPELRPRDVVIWDNLQPHKNPAVIAAAEAAGARVEPLPAYSPDLTPIEEMFSKTKAALRRAAARTTQTVMAAMGEALQAVTPTDIRGWFQHRCAYAMP